MRRTLHFVLAATLGLPSLAQSPAVAPATGLTDQVVFRFLFLHVVVTESNADDLKSRGQDDSQHRHYFKNAANLTDPEEALLKRIAADLDATLTAFDKSASVVVKQLRTLYPTKAQLPPAALQQLKDFDARRRKIVQDRMDALRSGMTPARYQQLHGFAWATESTKIKALKPTALPPGVKPPPLAR